MKLTHILFDALLAAVIIIVPKLELNAALHVSPWIVVNISESLLISKYLNKNSLREDIARNLLSLS